MNHSCTHNLEKKRYRRNGEFVEFAVTATCDILFRGEELLIDSGVSDGSIDQRRVWPTLPIILAPFLSNLDDLQRNVRRNLELYRDASAMACLVKPALWHCKDVRSLVFEMFCPSGCTLADSLVKTGLIHNNKKPQTDLESQVCLWCFH